MGPREELNKLKWGGGDGLRLAKVTILHRGAPGDKRVIGGEEILELGRGFIRVSSPEGEVEIPYHRVLRIEVKGQVIWQRGGVS